jgi:hypothetical protein
MLNPWPKVQGREFESEFYLFYFLFSIYLIIAAAL